MMTLRKEYLGAISMAILGWSLAADPAAACEMCWGAALDNPTTRGISMAMLLLIGMTGIVGGGIGAFFYNVQRRSKLLEHSDVVVTEYGDVKQVEDDAI